jgi:hypothetical protein
MLEVVTAARISYSLLRVAACRKDENMLSRILAMEYVSCVTQTSRVSHYSTSL